MQTNNFWDPPFSTCQNVKKLCPLQLYKAKIYEWFTRLQHSEPIIAKAWGTQGWQGKHEILPNYNNIINYQQRQSNQNIGSKMTKTE